MDILGSAMEQSAEISRDRSRRSARLPLICTWGPGARRLYELAWARRPLARLIGGADWAEADAGAAEKPFCFADAAGHRAVGVCQPCALGVLSGEQQAAADRLAQQVG